MSGGGASAASAAAQKFRLVCCDFLRGHCANGATACQYEHSDLTGKPCQNLDSCPLGHVHRKWQPDEDADCCEVCNGKFTIFAMRFRHHCRYCSLVVCGDCLERNPPEAPFPVCKRCLATVRE